jgi:hypothetical protein
MRKEVLVLGLQVRSGQLSESSCGLKRKFNLLPAGDTVKRSNVYSTVNNVTGALDTHRRRWAGQLVIRRKRA